MHIDNRTREDKLKDLAAQAKRDGLTDKDVVSYFQNGNYTTSANPHNPKALPSNPSRQGIIDAWGNALLVMNDRRKP